MTQYTACGKVKIFSLFITGIKMQENVGHSKVMCARGLHEECISNNFHTHNIEFSMQIKNYRCRLIIQF